jgi:hypothetical protein
MTLRLPLLGLWSVFRLAFSVDEDDLTILGILASVDVDDFLEWLPGCFLFDLEDLYCFGLISSGHKTIVN